MKYVCGTYLIKTKQLNSVFVYFPLTTPTVFATWQTLFYSILITTDWLYIFPCWFILALEFIPAPSYLINDTENSASSAQIMNYSCSWTLSLSFSLSLFCPSLDLLSHCSAVLPDPLTSIAGATKPQNFESVFQRSCDCDLFLSDILLVELLLPLPASVCPLCCLALQKTLLTPYLLVLSSQRVHFSKATQLANS